MQRVHLTDGGEQLSSYRLSCISLEDDRPSELRRYVRSTLNAANEIEKPISAREVRH